ncbi:hypothetical protein C8R45DRAFT_1087680 [Mycena sanguinolenta]|nr:hypothetical protein C8R45DRAFT_1087680 [Mycena sanguinolenta]
MPAHWEILLVSSIYSLLGAPAVHPTQLTLIQIDPGSMRWDWITTSTRASTENSVHPESSHRLPFFLTLPARSQAPPIAEQVLASPRAVGDRDKGDKNNHCCPPLAASPAAIGDDEGSVCMTVKEERVFDWRVEDGTG